MAALTNILTIAHYTLLVGFIGVTLMLLLVSVTNRLRLRNTLLVWRSGPLYGVPFRPTLFLLFLVGGITYALSTGQPLSAPVLSGYVAAGVFWFFASWVGNTTIVTEHGIVVNLNGANGTVAWGQVVDYFETGGGARDRYAFLYVDEKGARRRLEVAPPRACQKRFRQIIYTKLDARFNFTTEQTYGKATLEK